MKLWVSGQTVANNSNRFQIGASVEPALLPVKSYFQLSKKAVIGQEILMAVYGSPCKCKMLYAETHGSNKIKELVLVEFRCVSLFLDFI